MKRIIDVIVSLLVLVLLSSIIMLIALLIRLKIGSPVLFKQKRPGLHAKPFFVYKFRTMSDRRNEHGDLLPNEARITPLGRRLRKLSLDELPQLWNVLKGEMSLVGPRPLLMEYLPLYNDRQALRHQVRPGITGWAQVNGRNSISWEKKFGNDVWYVENQSFWLDVKILILTFKKVLTSEGVNKSDTLTMETFTGTVDKDVGEDEQTNIYRRREGGMNILITSAGRRVKLVQYFKRELENMEGSLIASDLDINAPALYFSDINYTVSEIFSENYIKELIDICKKYNVSAVLSLIDPELEILAANETVFAKEKIKVIVSEIEMIKMCFDKFEAYKFFCNKDLPTVPTFIDKDVILNKVMTGEYNFPLFVKPRTGSGSADITLVKDVEKLEAIDNTRKDTIFQPYFKDKEYGIDVYIDLLSGKLVDLFIKEKLLMRSGETDKSISVHDGRIEKLIKELIWKTNFRGPIDIDIFEYKGGFYISEINPRFGGGYPHAFECGVNFPAYIIKNLNGLVNEEYSGFTYDEGKVMMKYDDVLIR